MQTIELEAPYLHHRRQNTKPVFQELDQALSELTTARAEWTPENDTRSRIRTLADRVAELSADLAEVDDGDHELQTAEALRQEYCARLSGALQEVRKFSRMVASDEEGIAPLHKRLARTLADAEVYLTAFRNGTEARPQITAAFEAAKRLSEEFRVIDERLDRWAPKMAIAACDTALRQLSLPPRTTLEPEPKPRQFNHRRQQITDAIDVLRLHMGAVSLPGADEGMEQRQSVLQAVDGLRAYSGSDLFLPLNDSHVEEIRVRLSSIRRGLHALPSVPAIAVTPLRPMISDALRSYDLHLDKVEALLPGTSKPESPRPTNLLDRARQVFGWGDEPEAA